MFGKTGKARCNYYAGDDENYFTLTYEYNYDENGIIQHCRCVNKSFYGEERETVTDYEYKYDDSGNYVSTLSRGGKNIGKVDSQGNLVVLEEYDENGNLVTTTYNTFDARGNVILREFVGASDSRYDAKYSYVNTYSDGVILSTENPEP